MAPPPEQQAAKRDDSDESREKELRRSSDALFWSGLAGGLSMGFSFLGEALLRSHLPDAPWRPLVAKLGYSFGFLIVILGSQQLFTENTLTPMVPLLKEKTREMLRDVLRLWTVVFGANMIGTLLFGLALLVWMLPAAETASVPVIILMTWLIGAGGFAHVVAGSSEVFYAAWRGEATWAQATVGYVVPALIGNMLGGITLVAALNHAQVAEG